MKVIFVVDSLTDLRRKMSLFSGFGDNVLYVVNSQLEQIVKTYGVTPNAVYNKNLARTIHFLLEQDDIDNTIIYYSSLQLDADFLTEFLTKIGKGDKVITAMPQYNIAEKTFNACYNIYVKTIFKLKDSLASPKLQFLPGEFVAELMHTHIANRLFTVNSQLVTNVTTSNKEINQSLKVKSKFNPICLIPVIIALLLTAALLMSLALIGAKFILILTFVALYLIDILLGLGLYYKSHFDQRFLR